MEPSHPPHDCPTDRHVSVWATADITLSAHSFGVSTWLNIEQGDRQVTIYGTPDELDALFDRARAEIAYERTSTARRDAEPSGVLVTTPEPFTGIPASTWRPTPDAGRLS